MTKKEKLEIIDKLIAKGLSASSVVEILKLIGAPNYDEQTIKEIKLYSEHLPMGKEDPYTEEQRYLHFLWEAIDKVPLGIDAEFAIWYRQFIAQKLFKKCGKGFIAHENCRFNYGHHIEVGDFAAWNSGALIDAKGGFKMGDHAMFAENITVFTHAHSEADHITRIYKPVELKNHVTLGSGSVVLAGVTMHEGSFAAVGAVVTKDVPACVVVAGAPAKYLRDTKLEGKTLDETNAYFLEKTSFLR